MKIHGRRVSDYGGHRMKRREAEVAIVSVYRYEYLKCDNSVNAAESTLGALPFYTWLQQNRPDLLEFRCSGDQYQTVAGWIGRLRH